MAWFCLIAAALAACYLIARIAPERVTRLALAAERRHSGLALRSARVDGFDIPYLDGGQGEALLLIHGFGADKDNFTRVARYLTPHFRVIIPDLPGFGDAGRDPQADYFMADQVARMHALLAQLGVARVHLGGSSMGGFIAAQFAATWPAMTGSVWLIDAAGTAASYASPMAQHYDKTGKMPLLMDDPGQFDALVAATTHKTPFLPRFVRTTLARRAVADFALHTRIMRQLRDSPLLESLYSALATPALIVWGAEDGVLHPDGAAALAAIFTQAQVHIMPGLGHLPMAEAPQLVASDYLAFRRALARAADAGAGVPAPALASRG